MIMLLRMDERYKKLQKLHETAQFDFPWYIDDATTDEMREFANEAHDLVPELLDRIERLEEAMKHSSCPACGYAWEAKLWIKKYDENNQKS